MMLSHYQWWSSRNGCSYCRCDSLVYILIINLWFKKPVWRTKAHWRRQHSEWTTRFDDDNDNKQRDEKEAAAAASAAAVARDKYWLQDATHCEIMCIVIINGNRVSSLYRMLHNRNYLVSIIVLVGVKEEYQTDWCEWAIDIIYCCLIKLPANLMDNNMSTYGKQSETLH